MRESRPYILILAGAPLRKAFSFKFHTKKKPCQIKHTFFSATNTATEGFSPGLNETLEAPSTLSLSTIPFAHSEGRNTCKSEPTNRTACDSEIVYWRFQLSCDFCVKATSSSPVEAEKIRRFLCCAPSSSFTATVLERHVYPGKVVYYVPGRSQVER